jgi:hypothetical protein
VQPRTSRSPELSSAFVAALLLALEPRAALAQACCAGATALSPARLVTHEEGLAALSIKGTAIYGSFDPRGRFVGAARGSAEVGLEQDAIVTLRVLEKGQVSLVVPFVETIRRGTGITSAGGGPGDLSFSARWDFTEAGMSGRVPGIAVLAGVTLPTGIAPESAALPLGTDATGTGAFQGTFALALEQSFGKLLANLTGATTIHAARTAFGVRSRVGPQIAASGALGWSFDGGLVAALTASYMAGFASSSDGVPVPDSARSLLRLGLTAGYPLSDGWRLQGRIDVDPPLPHAGRNQPAGAGVTATLIRAWD